MRKRPHILNDTALKRIPIWPGYMAVEVDENGKESGPVNGKAVGWHALFLLILFGIAMGLVVLFWFIETLLGVPH